ncbi:MAG: XdhC family protein [Thermoflexibacter sp.]|jgi:xanthine/CO dehydrogenase XdhC/CoxF family maturation factor|nr:XdhC family protein [Thermoflexibacter sp.]
MRELEKIVETYNQINFDERKAALATVVRVQGSSYRRAGARMIMTDDGKWTGAISGGCLEGDALRRARQIITEGKPKIVRYDTTDDLSANSLGVGLGCNGIIDVLIEPVNQQDNLHHIHLLKSFLATPRPDQQIEVIATVFASDMPQVEIGERLFQRADSQILNFINHKELSDKISSLIPQIRTEGKSQNLEFVIENQYKVEVFLEVLKPAIHLIIFGPGYDAIPLVKLAYEVGWYVTLADDNVARLQPQRFPNANELIETPKEEIAEKLKFGNYTGAVLMSHSYKSDLAVLKQLIKTPIPYIGILGPKKRFDKMLAEIGGMTDEQLGKIHSPIGLDIGAETPEEIALSILAEIQARFAQRSGSFLKNRGGTIHERD